MLERRSRGPYVGVRDLYECLTIGWNTLVGFGLDLGIIMD